MIPKYAKHPTELPTTLITNGDKPIGSYVCIAYTKNKHYYAAYDYELKRWDYWEIGDDLVLGFHDDPDYWVPITDEKTGLTIEGSYYEKIKLY